MLKLRRSLPAEIITACLLALLSVLPIGSAWADDAEAERTELQLEVSINKVPAGKISNFVDLGGGRFASSVSELAELRIKTKPGLKPTDLVALDSIPGLSYAYDEPKQAIDITTVDDNRVANSYDARGELNQAKVTASETGAVLNYTLYGSYGTDDTITDLRSSRINGVNATLDARVIAPVGVFNQTAIVGMTLAQETDTLRLDSTYSFTNDQDMTRWRVGDFISGGTNWSRPVRLGGVQYQRAFTTRPDLVPSALPSVSGSAAVPSSVDVYVNGIKSYSKDVAAGPYQIDNIPSVTGPGVAQVVTRDASGRETVQSVSFYTSPQLLKPGLSDFSVETGVARTHYGIQSNDYDKSIAALATLRHGITDWMTLETHGEASEKLANGGVGFTANAKNRAIVSGAVSASTSDRGTGIQLYGGFETKVGRVSIQARSQHALGDYDDIASKTARDNPETTLSIGHSLTSGLFSYAPPRAIDSLTVSVPFTEDGSTLSGTYLRYETDDTGTTELLTATYTRPIYKTATMHATGFVDIANRDNVGAYVGVSMPLGDNISSNIGATVTPDRTGATATVSKAVAQQPGSWGFRVTDSEGDVQRRGALVGYRAEKARFEAGVVQEQDQVRGTATVDGAVALVKGDVYTSGRIEDSFAVVDVHAPNVKVQRENMYVGTTNADGKILIPNLSAYQRNKIGIDPMDLPLNSEPSSTYEYVRPAFKSGVYVDFDVKTARPSAIVILKSADGQFLPVGSEVRVEGSSETFVVGYDGETYITDMKPHTSLRVSLPKGECTAAFAFKPGNGVQNVVGPEICQ